jgi:hypothetical protein
VHFAVQQAVAADPGRVADAYVDPDFYGHLGRLPDVDPPEVLERLVAGACVYLRVRYRFTGELSPAVTRVIDPARLVWVEDAVHDLDTRTSSFRIVPEHYGSRLRCAGVTRVEERPGGSSARVVEGELQVRFPLVGRAVERAIASGLHAHLEREAALLDEWLAGDDGAG